MLNIICIIIILTYACKYSINIIKNFIHKRDYIFGNDENEDKKSKLSTVVLCVSFLLMQNKLRVQIFILYLIWFFVLFFIILVLSYFKKANRFYIIKIVKISCFLLTLSIICILYLYRRYGILV